MFLDRRAKKRETVRTIAEYKTMRPSKSIKFKAPAKSVSVSLLDISVKGCALDSPQKVPIDATIRVRIDPLAFAIEAAERRKEPLEMTGRVVSCIARSSGRYRLGACFSKIKKADIGLIKRFMKIKERRKFPRWEMFML